MLGATLFTHGQLKCRNCNWCSFTSEWSVQCIFWVTSSQNLRRFIVPCMALRCSACNVWPLAWCMRFDAALHQPGATHFAGAAGITIFKTRDAASAQRMAATQDIINSLHYSACKLQILPLLSCAGADVRKCFMTFECHHHRLSQCHSA